MGLEALDRFADIDLRNVEDLAAVIHAVGCSDRDVPPPCMSQVPMEFSYYLAHLADIVATGYRFLSICEIGSLFGWSLHATQRYLEQLQGSKVNAVAIDIAPQIDPALPITVCTGASAAFSCIQADLVFIDAAHDYESVRADWLNVGCHADFCAMHDIADDRFSVRKLYAELKKTEKLSREIVLTANRYGIGVFDNRSRK